MEHIDLAIIIGFLIITLIVGIGNSGKIKTIQDYALGGRNFSTGALVATIVATYASASGFFININRGYSDGLFFIVAASCMTIHILITAYFLVPRMGEFLKNTSVAESMGDLYGKEVRIITAIAATIGSAGFIAVQFKAFGSVTAYFTGISVPEAVIGAGIIVTLYSALGGIRAVTTTDILQFFTFGFAIPLIGIMIWNQVYIEDRSLSGILNSPNFQVKELFNTENAKFWPMITLMFYFTVPGISPTAYQRILIGKNLPQIKKAFIISAFLYLAILLSTCWISFLVLDVNDHLESNQVLGFIINSYAYPGLKGLIIIGVIAMAMSTADSYLNTSSILISHDICEPLNIVGEEKKLFLSKCFSLTLGFGAIMLALSEQDLLSIVLFANSFYLPIVSVPLVLTILGFRSTKLSVLMAMGAGFFTVVIWKSMAIKTDPIFFAMSANLIFLFGSHYLLKQPGGWVGIKDKKSYYQLVNSEITEKNTRADKIHNFSFIEYCRKKFPNNGLSYTGLGIYFIIFTISTMYSTQSSLLQENKDMIIRIYQIMMVTGVVIAMYPIWPLSIRQELKETIVQIAWPVTTFYMLIVFNFLFMLISNFGLLQFSIFSVNLVITSVLVGWRLASIMIAFGVAIVSALYIVFFSHYEVNFSVGSPGFIGTYALMLAAATLIIFIKPKQEHQKATEDRLGYLTDENATLIHKIDDYSAKVSIQEKEIERLSQTAQMILNNVNHELRLPVGNVINFAEMLSNGLTKFSKEQLKTLSEEIYKNSNRLSSMILNMLDLAILDSKKIELQKKTVNLSELVEDRARHCFRLYKDDKDLSFKLDIEPEILIKLDPNYIRQVVDNLVINAIKYSNNGTIMIKLHKSISHVEFTITDEGLGILPEEIYDIFKPFQVSSKTMTPSSGRGVGLALCKSAIEAHGGKIIASSDGKIGAKFRFMLVF